MVDKEKRRRIMQRSIKLGHCICNPKQPCPCDVFKEQNVCLCAGERLEGTSESVPLTRFVENAGCASKINQTDLKIVLAGLPPISNPRVLVSAETCDDAGVFKLTEDTALVQSIDVFTPNVDDAYIFGQIAAANSLSDIYAMGGTPLTALSVVGFPIETMSHKVMNRMLRGGIEKMKEAGVEVIGGHSIKDIEIKFGFSVTGVIDPKKIITNDKAKQPVHGRAEQGGFGSHDRSRCDHGHGCHWIRPDGPSERDGFPEQGDRRDLYRSGSFF
jgi:hypothetical protein